MDEITIKQLDEDLAKLEERVQKLQDYLNTEIGELSERLNALENWAEEKGFIPEPEDEA